MRIGVSFKATAINEEIIRQYHEAGIDCIEVSCSYMDDFRNVDFDEIKRLCDLYHITIWSYHLSFFPFDALDIASKEDALREFTILTLKEQIIRASRVGIDKFIIHPGAEPYPDEEREEYIDRAARSLKILSEVAKSVGGVLCVENLPRSCLSRCSDDMMKLLSYDEKLMVCFDTNHLLIEDPFVFINRLRERIVTVHISDYDFINERHWLPGEGKLDFYKIYQALLDINFDGVWLYEVTPFQSETETIKRGKAPNLHDFYKNAQEIFENKPLTVYGTPTI